MQWMFLQMLRNQSLVVCGMRLVKLGTMGLLCQQRLVGQRMMFGWVIWVLRVSEIPVAKIVVIDSGDSVAGSSTKGMFAVEIYQRVPSVIDEFDRSRVFVSKVVSRDVISGLSSYSVPLCRAFYVGGEVISGTVGNSGEGSFTGEG
jgi:hypothetical protein